MDLVARLDEANEASTRSTARIDVASSLEESSKASKRSMALVDIGGRPRVISEALIRSMAVIDAEVAEGIDHDTADSTERLNSLSRIRRLSLEAKSMQRSSVCALRAMGSSPQLSQSSGYVLQRRMSKEHTSAAAD